MELEVIIPEQINRKPGDVCSKGELIERAKDVLAGCSIAGEVLAQTLFRNPKTGRYYTLRITATLEPVDLETAREWIAQN
jgi:hypothetical protein